MKTVCYFTFFLLALFSVACSDNDEKPVALYVSSGQVQINEFSVSVGENWLRAGGGSGVYTVYSSDVDIVKAEISKDVITLKAYQVGVVEITVKDNRDEQATIRVTVIPRVMSMEVTEIYPHIEYIDNEKGIEVEEEVKKDIIENLDVSVGWRFELERKNWNGKYNSKGKLTVYPVSGGEPIEGTFKIGYGPKTVLTLEYGDQKHILETPEVSVTGKSRDTGPLHMTFVLDYTGKYSGLYPGANFSHVGCGIKITM